MNVKHNKEEVLRIGLRLFCEKGYNRLGIDEICLVTGMTKGAFYNAYKSKEQFLIDAVTLYSINNVTRIKAQLQPDNTRSAYTRLHQFYVKMLQIQPSVNFTGCFINNTMSELGFVNERVGVATASAFNEFIDAILPTVKEAQQNKELNAEMDSRQLTELIHSTFYGALTIAKSSRNFNQSIDLVNLLFNTLKYK